MWNHLIFTLEFDVVFLNCSMNQDVSPSVSDIDHYIIITKLVDSGFSILAVLICQWEILKPVGLTLFSPEHIQGFGGKARRK
jgi:hypothetical protein